MRPPLPASAAQVRALAAQVEQESAELSAPELKRQRSTEAYLYRLAGLSTHEIAARLGVDVAMAHQMLLDVEHPPADTVEALRELENARLDRAQSAIWERVMRGDDDAINTFLRISARRSQLNGMNAPTKIDIRVGIKQEMEAALAELESLVLGKTIEGELVDDNDPR